MSDTPRTLHFIEQIIEADNASGTWGVWTPRDNAADKLRAGKPRVHTRFPPEPNGYLHIGHAKSINLNDSLARKYDGKFNLRFDDTNPAKEEQEYVDSIIRDVVWLGGDFEDRILYASDYFDQMYAYAVELVKKGKAYVCDLSADDVSKRRGTPQIPATSPFRDRPVEESLKLLDEMRRGVHPDGSRTLRAKIDLASPNFNLRDPVMYRIVHETHHNTGDAWCIYPMYDWAHGLEDSIEGITHSICTLEFENHRPLYDWFIDAINEGRSEPGNPWGPPIHHPQQIEFAKFRPTHTVMSKRNLLKMVQAGIVRGWDDPRMPTISGLRRRGYTAQAIRKLVDDIGVTKTESMIDLGRLENSVRDHLNRIAPRAMAVLKPLKVVITNWPKDSSGMPIVEELDYVINPEDEAAGTRKIQFSGEIFIERDDFMESPPKGYFRLFPGNEVRLRWAYFVTCTGVEKNAAGEVVRVNCTYDPATRGGDAPVGPDGKPTKKVKGTIHWVSARHAVDAEVRLFDRLFTCEVPGDRTGNYEDDLNKNSLDVLKGCKIEPHVAATARFRVSELQVAGHAVRIGEGDRLQFERLGYFCVDPDSATSFGGAGNADAGLVLNRTVTLKDSWAKESGKA
ncbi:MAG: glutamine--tRNA ligase/YqeY domain fusion protein [Planctomycetota bacterium]|nr:glutamine--tRNA ligase/YqeY domain fusion protein [Planctomycetota bacterium]